jgi:hypothetical protein
VSLKKLSKKERLLIEERAAWWYSCVATGGEDCICTTLPPLPSHLEDDFRDLYDTMQGY